jgi:hypothetical protein
MSPSARRRSQAHTLAASLPHALWRGDSLGSHPASSISTGFSELNRELPGGGWQHSVLTELLWTQQGGGEFRLLAPVLAELSRAGKTIILLAPPHSFLSRRWRIGHRYRAGSARNQGIRGY